MSISDWLLQQEKVDTSSVVQTLIDNGKLANQIARLQAIVVKNNVQHNQTNVEANDEDICRGLDVPLAKMNMQN